jgi:hypothetical protein
MAGFCHTCIRIIAPEVPPQNNDMAHGETGQLLWDICEECGPGWFDAQGKRVKEKSERTDTTQQKYTQKVE